MSKKSWWDRHSAHWQWYRDFFSVGIFRYFVLWFSVVPLFVHALGSLPAVIPIGVGKAVVLFKPELPFNWVLLWLASVFYTAALFVFIVRCPDLIKKYPTFSKYKEYGHSPRWVVWLVRDVAQEGGSGWDKLRERLRQKGYATALPKDEGVADEVIIEERTTSFQFRDDDRRSRFELPVVNADGSIDERATDGAEREVFWEVFGAKAGSRTFSRVAVVALLSASLLLFLIVLAQHIWAAVPGVIDGLIELLLPIKLYISGWFVLPD